MKIKRREFLKGLGLSSLALSTQCGSLFAKDAQVKGGNAKNYGMIFDQTKCVGCGKCEPACDKTNDVAEGQHRLFVEDKSDPKKPTEKVLLRVSCQQCKDAPCVTVCPTQATHRDAKTNIVDINKSKCIGCGYCVVACPYDACYISKKTKSADRCNFCLDTKLSKNETPACVESCKYDALVFGDLNDKNSYISKLLKVKDAIRLKPELGTNPSLRYIPTIKRGV